MKYFGLTLTLISLLACSRAEKNNSTSLSFQLPSLTAQAGAISDFNCYGLFVSGNERQMQKESCSLTNGTTAFNYGYFLGGYYSPTTAAGTSFQVEVPNGPDRVLRLVGLKVDTMKDTTVTAGLSNRLACEQMKILLSRNSGYFERPYLLAESAQLQLKGDEQSIDMPVEVDSGKRLSTCTSLGVNAESNPPAKLGLIFQDNLIGLGNALSYSSCVGLTVQVQDMLGNRAQIESGQNITAKITATVGGQSIGDFYFPTAGLGTDICSAANMITKVSGDISVNFYIGSKTVSDVVLFFKPASSFSFARQILASTVGGALTGASLLYLYQNSPTRLPQKYAFYDLFSNASSYNSTTSTPVKIRRGECRLAGVQYLDQYSVPTTPYTSALPKSILINDSAAAGAVKFFTNQADCQAGSPYTDDFVFQPVASSLISTSGFYYKIDSAHSGEISFSIANLAGTGTPVIASGDLSASDNLWQVSD